MLSYETIVAPLARSLWSLEATTANPSDAFVFWMAIAHTLDSIFQKKEKNTGINAKLAGRVRAIFNTRYLQFFNHNDVCFVAFCLDPRSLYISAHCRLLTRISRISKRRIFARTLGLSPNRCRRTYFLSARISSRQGVSQKPVEGSAVAACESHEQVSLSFNFKNPIRPRDC
jgi:hypothetical protein